MFDHTRRSDAATPMPVKDEALCIANRSCQIWSRANSYFSRPSAIGRKELPNVLCRKDRSNPTKLSVTAQQLETDLPSQGPTGIRTDTPAPTRGRRPLTTTSWQRRDGPKCWQFVPRMPTTIHTTSGRPEDPWWKWRELNHRLGALAGAVFAVSEPNAESTGRLRWRRHSDHQTHRNSPKPRKVESCVLTRFRPPTHQNIRARRGGPVKTKSCK